MANLGIEKPVPRNQRAVLNRARQYKREDGEAFEKNGQLLLMY